MATGTDILKYSHPMSLYFSYFISHYQFGKTNQYEKAKIELMGYLCADLAFDFLRTKSTLGYLCFSKVIKVSDYYGFSINIGAQRDRFSAEEVYSKVLEFNDLFIEHLRTMPQSRFDNYRRSYAIELKKVPQAGFQNNAT
jgi:secreted Zn-dependent insulinase-like peptidase